MASFVPEHIENFIPAVDLHFDRLTSAEDDKRTTAHDSSGAGRIPADVIPITLNVPSFPKSTRRTSSEAVSVTDNTTCRILTRKKYYKGCSHEMESQARTLTVSGLDDSCTCDLRFHYSCLQNSWRSCLFGMRSKFENFRLPEPQAS